MNLYRRQMFAAAMAITTCCAGLGVAQAAGYPAKPITVIVSYPRAVTPTPSRACSPKSWASA